MNPEEVGDAIRTDLKGVSWERVLALSSLVVLGFVIGVRFSGILVTGAYGHADVDVELVRQMKIAILGGTGVTVTLVVLGFSLTHKAES